MKKYLLFVLIIASLVGCKKSDTDPAPQPVAPKYFLVSSNAQFGGHISTLQKGVVIGNAYSLDQTVFEDRFADVALSGDRLYAVRATTQKIDILESGSMTLVKTISYGKVSTGNYFKQIEYANNKIVVADAAYLPNTPFDYAAFLKVIDPGTGAVDSIPVTRNSFVRAMGGSGNNFYISLVREDGKRVIRVFDSGFQAIKDIDLGSDFCNGIDFDKDGNIIVIMYNGVATIRKTDFSITKNILIYAAPVNLYGDQFTNSRSFCLDRENGILYFLRRAAQPAPGPYTLASYNLATDEVNALTTNFFYASTIAYDASQKLVIMGDFPPSGSPRGGTVKLYSTLGVLSSQFTLPTVPSEILIR